MTMDIPTLFANHELAFYAVRAAVLAIALLAFAFALGRWRRSGTRQMQRLFAELDESRGETRALTELAQRLAAQLEAMQARFDDRQHLAAATTGPAQRGYDLALHLARQGASVDEIVSASGVTRHEASLLAHLHNPSRH